jgi:biotin-dependent carboxylase-like uncharacterized protein
VNTLAGNAENTPAIEMLYSGATLRMRGGSTRIAVCGADATIVRASGESSTLPQWHSATLQDGDEVRVGSVRVSAAAYLAVEGGLEVPPALGSASTYLRGALGGWQGRTLRVGDALPLARSRATKRPEHTYSIAPALHAPARLRVMLGPQADRFAASSIEALLAHEYTVSPASDRSGLRLEGELLRHVGGYDLASEGVACGSIQVPGSGQPVILIGDHPTVGGYPKIATIVSADLAAAGRLRIGSRVRFEGVDENQARVAREQARADYARIVQSITEART